MLDPCWASQSLSNGLFTWSIVDFSWINGNLAEQANTKTGLTFCEVITKKLLLRLTLIGGPVCFKSGLLFQCYLEASSVKFRSLLVTIRHARSFQVRRIQNMIRVKEVLSIASFEPESGSLWYEAGMAHIGLSELFQSSDQIIKQEDRSGNSFIIL